jgi:hypothetical protein
MDNEKANAVLRVLEQFFTDEESPGHPAILGDCPQLIGEKLGLPPAEVLVLLRILHRKGLIGLFGGIGPQVMVARDQSLLRPPTAVITDGGKNAKLGKWRRNRTSEEPTEDELPPETAELLEYIDQLEKLLDEVQARAEHAEKRRRNISDARQRSDEAKTEADKALRRSKAENTTLKTEADKVPGLERQIAELQGRRVIPDDLAETLARLTQ